MKLKKHLILTFPIYNSFVNIKWEKAMRLLDTYKNVDSTKVAEIFLQKEHFVVRFMCDNQFLGEIEYVNKSIHYVKDAAENFVIGIFKSEDVKRYSREVIA